MSVRDWLIIIGITIIIAILIDGYRRMRLARKRASELNFGLETVKKESALYSSELPNGGARPRNNDMSKVEKEREDPVFPDWNQSNEEPSIQETLEKKQKHHKDDIFVDVRTTKNTLFIKKEQIHNNKMINNQTESDVDFPKDNRNSAVTLRPKDREKLSERPPAKNIFVINVAAKEGSELSGEKLLKSLVASGMCFGEGAIFHRHEKNKTKDRLIFSMANGIEPGTFDLDIMENTATPVVIFFMVVPGTLNPLKAFSLMLEVAKQLALDTGGEMKDDQMSVLTQQNIEHNRQRIAEYERKQFTVK